MNILILGGCGYIGSVLSKMFLSADYNITIVDNLLYKQGHLVVPILSNKRCTFLKKDIRSINESLIKNYDIIYLLAAYVGPICDKYPKEAIQTNILATKKLVNILSPRQKLIYCCSSSGYGDANKECSETDPFRSISLYAKTKEKGEEIILSKLDTAVSLRLATVWGYSYRHRFDLLVNNLVWQACKKNHISLFQGNYKRAYANIMAVAKLLFIYAPNLTGVFNFATDNCSKYELVNKIKYYIPTVHISINDSVDFDKRNYFLNCNKLKKVIPTSLFNDFSLEKELNSLIQYYDFLSPECSEMISMRNS